MDTSTEEIWKILMLLPASTLRTPKCLISLQKGFRERDEINKTISKTVQLKVYLQLQLCASLMSLCYLERCLLCAMSLVQDSPVQQNVLYITEAKSNLLIVTVLHFSILVRSLNTLLYALFVQKNFQLSSILFTMKSIKLGVAVVRIFFEPIDLGHVLHVLF